METSAIFPPLGARDYAAIGDAFQAEVLSGAFPCGSLFRAAVERQARDLASPPAGYVWNDRLASRICRFAEHLPFVDPDALRGQPIRLRPWQIWLLRVLEGWRDAATGDRRWRDATIFLPKGNGKSPLAAIVALYVLCSSTGAAKVYSAANSTAQAREVWLTARDMLRLDSAQAAEESGGRVPLIERYQLDPRQHDIIGVGDGRMYRAVSRQANTVEGIKPALIVIDEIHAIGEDRALFDNLTSASRKVQGSLLLLISTAGTDQSPGSVGWQQWLIARDILLGKADAPESFALIAHADPEDDPYVESTWRKANPNLGVSVSVAGLAAGAKRAQAQPSELPGFKVKHLNVWSTGSEVFIDPARWRALAVPALTIEATLDDPAWANASWFIGIDLARTRDLTAAVAVAARLLDNGERVYRVISRGLTWLPAESPTLAETPSLRLWAGQGWLTLTPGPTFNPATLKAALLPIALGLPNVEICFDEWCALELEAEFSDQGLTVAPVRQGARTQSQPMKALEAAILEGHVEHDASPILEWCMGNLESRRDRNGNIAPQRPSDAAKIDIAVALVNAFVRASVAPLDDGTPIDPASLYIALPQRGRAGF